MEQYEKATKGGNLVGDSKAAATFLKIVSPAGFIRTFNDTVAGDSILENVVRQSIKSNFYDPATIALQVTDKDATQETINNKIWKVKQIHTVMTKYPDFDLKTLKGADNDEKASNLAKFAKKSQKNKEMLETMYKDYDLEDEDGKRDLISKDLYNKYLDIIKTQ